MSQYPDDLELLRKERASELAAKPSRFKRAVRVCLSCRRPFDSSWCGNRMCRGCREHGHVPDPEIGRARLGRKGRRRNGGDDVAAP